MQIKLTSQTISQESNILGLSKDELFSLVSDFESQPKRASMRVNQLWSWIYCHGMSSFDNMTNIDKSLRSKLQKVFNISRPAIEKKRNQRRRYDKIPILFRGPKQNRNGIYP